MKTHPKKKARGLSPDVPDDAKCINCLGSGEVFFAEGVNTGQRIMRTVMCPDCQGRGMRVIPLRDLQ